MDKFERKILNDELLFLNRNNSLASSNLLQSIKKRPNIGRLCSVGCLGKLLFIHWIETSVVGGVLMRLEYKISFYVDPS
jgi:hypothetical protein